LIFAAENGHDEVVKLLVSKGANIRITRSDGKSAIDLARENKYMAVEEILLKLNKGK
jgi:ankyrin repeat protein